MKNILAFLLFATVSAPFAVGAQTAAGSCERNAAMAQTLSDNGGPYLAPICLGSPDSTDAPGDRATHAQGDVTRMPQCPPGVSGAVCFLRRKEVFAYACGNGMLPQTAAVKMQKTPQGCEGDKPGVPSDKDVPQKPKNCPVFKVDAWRITCPATPQPAVFVGSPTFPSTPVPVPPREAPVPVAATPATLPPPPVVTVPPLKASPVGEMPSPDAGPASPPDAGMPGPAPDASAGMP